MAVAVDVLMTVGNGGSADCQTANDATSIDSTGITVSVGASLLTCIPAFRGNSVAPASVSGTWNGVALNQAMQVTNGLNSVGVYTLVSPASGAQTLHLEWTNAADCYMSAISFTGTDTVTGYNASDNQNSTTTSVTITSTTDGATVAVSCKDSGDPTMNQTQIFVESPLAPGGGGSYALGGTSNEHTFTYAGGSEQINAGIHITSSGALTITDE